uniref:Ig-like domain-containing protein n=1 Tax=Lates calcarifer TaxID=8187 RepID=A0A4W6BPY8_LATCA
VTRYDQGPFRCHVFSPVNNGTSDPVKLSISCELQTYIVKMLESTSSVSLSCSSAGSSLSFLWLNGSSEVTASDRIQLTDRNTTLTIYNVTRHDQGPFRCRVFNPVSDVTIGPEDINLIVSPLQEYYDEGSDISLMCSVLSSPAAWFQWFLNGDKLPHTGPELRLMNIQMSQSGNYSCQAFNNITMRNQTSHFTVAVFDWY